MAQRTVITLVDDMTGEEGENVKTVEFALEGVSYEIDLDEENQGDLTDFLAAYIANARRVGGRAKRGSGSAQARPRSEAKEIRDWAKAQGIEVNERGRIPGEIVEKWENR